jgi:hypothetical protein
MIKSAKELNYRVNQRKQVRDTANSNLDKHMETCVLCKIESQSSLKTGCLQGHMLRKEYEKASKNLSGI